MDLLHLMNPIGLCYDISPLRHFAEGYTKAALKHVVTGLCMRSVNIAETPNATAAFQTDGSLFELRARGRTLRTIIEEYLRGFEQVRQVHRMENRQTRKKETWSRGWERRVHAIEETNTPRDSSAIEPVQRPCALIAA